VVGIAATRRSIRVFLGIEAPRVEERMAALPRLTRFFGVDFSGAKLAGRNTWVAGCVRNGRDLALDSLDCLENLAGTGERGPALRHLVALVKDSEAAAWGMDFPFGLPVEIFPPAFRWAEQFGFLAEYGDDAYACGLECVRRTRAVNGRLHVRRHTDHDAKTPFDCYHYRIIYQTFFGMRDVIGPLRRSPGTCVLPFQYSRLPVADRVVFESCPASTLKKLGLPHQNYKQSAGGPLTSKRLRTRRAILDELIRHVRIDPPFRRVVMRNPGGDALDAVIAAVGAYLSFHSVDHAAIARHPRFRREGHLYV
jgi:hypothetical protein